MPRSLHLPAFRFAVLQLQTIGMVHPSCGKFHRFAVRSWGLVIFISIAIFTSQKLVSVFVSDKLSDRATHIRDADTMGLLLIILAQFYRYSDRFYRVMEGLSVTDDLEAKTAVEATSRTTTKLAKLYTADIIVLAVLIMMAPIKSGAKSALNRGNGTWRIVHGFPMSVWYPIEISSYPVYAALYTLQSLPVAAEMFGYTTFFCTFVTFCFHISTQFRILTARMKTCSGHDIRRWIQKHQSLLQLVAELNFVVKSTMGWYVLFAVVCMGTTSIEIITVEMASPKQMAAALYLISQAVGLLLCCYLGDFVTEAGEKLYESTALSPWIEMDLPEQKLMITVCGQTARPVTIQAGSIFSLSLPLYSELIKTWYQLFNILQKLM